MFHHTIPVEFFGLPDCSKSPQINVRAISACNACALLRRKLLECPVGSSLPPARTSLDVAAPMSAYVAFKMSVIDCYLSDSGLYVHESCCLGAQRHLPTYESCSRFQEGHETSVKQVWCLISVTAYLYCTKSHIVCAQKFSANLQACSSLFVCSAMLPTLHGIPSSII
jgi:hypothetical protein